MGEARGKRVRERVLVGGRWIRGVKGVGLAVRRGVGLSLFVNRKAVAVWLVGVRREWEVAVAVGVCKM